MENYILKYLEENKFAKTLDYWVKKLNDKKIILYGSGVFLKVLLKNYNLKKLNIIAISDQKFVNHKENEMLWGYKVIAPSEIITQNPDIVLVSTEKFVNIMNFLRYDLLLNSKIEVQPLVKLPFCKLLKQIF